MADQTNQEETYSTEQDSKINNVVALTQLVGTIVDYYSFTNKLIEDEDEVDKYSKEPSREDESPIIPKKIDSLIEKTFLSQLNKFIE